VGPIEEDENVLVLDNTELSKQREGKRKRK
jgi:hypothetical protein